MSLPVDPATSIVSALAALMVPQIALTAWFVAVVRGRTREFRARDGERQAAAEVPAEVVLCLRGCDATLADVFAALADQSHRAWSLRVVVDSPQDPAWEAAQAAVTRLEAGGRVAWSGHVIEPLARRPVRGSLKCASLRQALLALEPRTRVVALVDADSVVHRDWLLTLVDECLRPGVGAVSGNRWYAPLRPTAPAVVRGLWNAGAIVQMTTFGIPWGGSLAVRREAAAASGWADVIASTLCEDTALAAPLAAAGWSYRFVPALIAVDRDDAVGLGPLTRWIARQLLTARLHHPAWGLVAAHGLATSLALAAAVAAAAWAWSTARPGPLAVLAGGLVAYEAANVLLLVVIAAAVRGALAASARAVPPLQAGRGLWSIVCIPAAQVVYAIAVIRAVLARTVEWRGVTYRIERLAGRHTVAVVRDDSRPQRAV